MLVGACIDIFTHRQIDPYAVDHWPYTQLLIRRGYLRHFVDSNPGSNGTIKSDRGA